MNNTVINFLYTTPMHLTIPGTGLEQNLGPVSLNEAVDRAVEMREAYGFEAVYVISSMTGEILATAEELPSSQPEDCPFTDWRSPDEIGFGIFDIVYDISDSID